MAEVSEQKSLVVPDERQQEPLDWNSVDSPEFQVLMNSLLFNKIAEYLAHSDLKALSETGKLLLGCTRSCWRFVQNTQLNILRGRDEMDLDLLKSEFIPWKTVKLAVQKWKRKDYGIMQHILSMPSVVTLELDLIDHSRSKSPPLKSQVPNTSEPGTTQDSIVQLILSAQNLQSLKLNAELLAIFKNIFNSPELQSSLRSLHTLSISLGNQYRHNSTTINDFVGGIRSAYRNPILSQNMTALSQIMSRTNLRSFTFQVNLNDRMEGEVTIPYHDDVVELIFQNRNTLEQISLHGRVWSHKDLASITCPFLKSLDVEVRTTSAKNVAAFIEHQPFLRSLTLGVAGKILETSELPNAIRRRSSKLERLHISWHLTQNSSGQLDWGFLQGLKALKDLSICQVEERWTTDERRPVPRLLAHLPTSLKKLQIYSYPMASQIKGLDLILISALKRLKCLTVLDLKFASPSTLTDTGLLFVCSRMTQLLVLRVNDSVSLTDFGITGKRMNGTDLGISIANLKGLQTLRIGYCKKVSWAALLSVLKFRHLKQAHLSIDIDWDDVRATSDLLVKMATQNPRLEEFTIGRCYIKDKELFSKEQMMASIQKRLPRFKCLRIYSWSHWPDHLPEPLYLKEHS